MTRFPGAIAFAGALAIGAVLGAAPASADWIASGQFLYRDREQNLVGFTGVETNRPARRVDVQIVDATTSAVLASGATDAAGFYSIPVVDAQTRNVRPRMVSLSSQTVGLLIDVRNNATARLPYMVNGAQVNGHAPTAHLDFGAAVALPAAGGEAFNLYDVLLNDTDFLATILGAWPSIRITCFWETGSSDGTFFRPSDNTIHLTGGKGYDDTVVGHEHGHFVSRNWSKDNNPGGSHFIGDNNQDIRLAWSEGWATFFASAVRRALGLGPSAPQYIDTDGSPGVGNLNFAYEVETPSEPANGGASEVAVTSALWEILDDPATPDGSPGVDDDLLARPFSSIWTVFHDYLPLPSVTNVSLEDFWDGWFQPGNSQGFDAEMKAAFGALDIEYFEDAGEQDDTFATAKIANPNGTPLPRTFYGAGDVDVFKFITTAGKTYVAETTDLLSDANTTMTVFAPDQTTVLGTNDNRGAFDASSRVQFTAAASGVHYAVVSHAPDLGVYGSYTFRLVGSDQIATSTFTNVAPSLNVAKLGNVRGTAWGDVNGDGRLDLFVSNIGGTASLYRNGPTTFNDVAAAWGAAVTGSIEGGAFCDYDKDGDLDLYVTAIGPNTLLQNRRAQNGDSVFVNVTAAAGVARSFDGRSAAWADADRDGWADLFVTDNDGQPALYRNQHDGTFVDILPTVGIATGTSSVSCAWSDYDHDGDDDLYLVINGGPSRLYRNQLKPSGTLSFQDVTAPAGNPVAGTNSFACEWGDVDGDGWLDLYVVDGGGPNFLYRNNGNGTFTDVAYPKNAIVPQISTCSAWGDFDNDGELDLFVGNLNQPGQTGTSVLLENVGGTFASSALLAVSNAIRSATWADFDNDLDVDLYMGVTGGASELHRNDTPNHNAVHVSLIGRQSNRDGFGARVRCKSGFRTLVREVSGGAGFGSQSSPMVEFGLGALGVADSVIVDWPNGGRSVLVGVTAGSYVVDETTAVEVPPTGVEFALALAGARPNPTAGPATIGFTVPGISGQASVPTKVAIYSVTGRLVRTLVDGPLAPGPQVVAFDGLDDGGVRLAPGVYVSELVTSAGRAAKKVVLLGR
jgi:hypothetical protein